MRDQLLTRRQLTAQFAALSAAAAINPFPKIVTATRASAQATPAPAPAPPEQQVLRFGSFRAAQTRMSQRGLSGDFLGTFTQSLFLTPFVPNNAGELMPGTCIDYTASGDGLTYTLTLDPAARFSDGSKITADDIAFTWNYHTSPEGEFPFRGYSTFMIEGYEQVSAGEASEMSGLAVIDEETLEVRLARPFTPFPYYLSHYFQGVQKRAEIEQGGPDWDARPTIASGPYVCEVFNPDTSEIVIVPNPSWWRDPPMIQRIEHRFAPDPNSMLVLWGNDEVDDFFYINIPAQFAAGDDGQYLVDVPEYESSWFNLNAAIAPTDDQFVRRALLLASDTASVVPAVTLGDSEAAFQITPPAMPGTRVREPFFDPEAARAALAGSSYGGPEGLPVITWAVGPNTIQSQSAQALAQIWRDVLGVEVSVVPLDSGVDATELGTHITYGANGNVYDAPGAFLTWGWHANNAWFREDGGIGVIDQEIEDLIREAESRPLDDSPEGAAEPFNRAEDLILERAYAIPHAHKQQRHAVKPWVINYEFNPTLNALAWNAYIAEH